VRKNTRNLLSYCGWLGTGLFLMSYGEAGTLIGALGNGIWLSTGIFGIGYFTVKFFGTMPDIDRSEQLRKNTSRIYELEKEVGLRDE
jgi:hypothetical protein